MFRFLSSVLADRVPTAAVIGAGILFASLCLVPDTRSQAPALATVNATLLTVLGKLKTQQDQIDANQTKIEAQTALLKEELRQAKLYSARAGGHR